MKTKLIFMALIKFLLGFILIGMLVFLPSFTFNYINGYIFMGCLFIPMLLIGVYLFIKDPSLLERRLNSKEKINKQSLIIKLCGLMFIIGFIVSSLDFRFKWSYIPLSVSIVFAVIFVLFYLMYFEVLRENTYLSRTIEVSENQKVIDTGLYGIVRHPMYTASIFMFISIPLILGSLIGFFIFLIYPIVIVIRLKNEEKFLEKELDGYKDYKNKIKYRLIPFIY